MREPSDLTPLGQLARIEHRQGELAVRLAALSQGLTPGCTIVSISDGSVVQVGPVPPANLREDPGTAAHGPEDTGRVADAGPVADEHTVQPESEHTPGEDGNRGDSDHLAPDAEEETDPETAPPSDERGSGVGPAPAPAPVKGAQWPALGMWRPGRRDPAARDIRLRVRRRVQTLSETVRALRQTVERLESICTFMGECVLLTVDPETPPRSKPWTAPPASPSSPGSSGSPGGTGSDLLGALLALLAALRRTGGDPAGTPGAGPGDGDSGPSSAGDGEAGKGGTGEGGTAEPERQATAGAPASAQGQGDGNLATLAQLVQYLSGRTSASGDNVAERLVAALASPAFQDLLRGQPAQPGPS